MSEKDPKTLFVMGFILGAIMAYGGLLSYTAGVTTGIIVSRSIAVIPFTFEDVKSIFSYVKT